MESILLSTIGISRVFRSGNDDFYALRDVDVEIPSNKLTILRGRSGSGKTTLLNILGTLDHPTKGQVLFKGKDLTVLKDNNRDEFRRVNVGFIFQSIALISTMSAYENVDFCLRIAGISYKERKVRTEECLALVGLEDRMFHRTQELSGGEQQRVAIARAIVHHPDVVFADEPTAELDTSTGLQVVRLFKNVIDELGVTIVMTTHDPEMMDIGDKVIMLEDGQVVK